MKKTVTAHHGCLRLAAEYAWAETQQAWAARPGPEQLGAAAAERRVDDTVIAQRIRRTFTEVHEPKAAGLGMRRIKKATGLAKATVARYYKAETVDELLVTTRTGKSSLLDEYKPTSTSDSTPASPTSDRSGPRSASWAARPPTARCGTT